MMRRVGRARRLPRFAAAVLALAVGSPARSQVPVAAKVGAPPPSGVLERAPCVVMLRGGTQDRSGGAVDPGVLVVALTSTALVDPAAQAALGL